MKNETKLNPPSSHPSLLPRLGFTPDSSTSPSCMAQGFGEWGLWSVAAPYLFSRSIVGWIPLHEMQSFRSLSNMGPSHGLQAFMNCSSTGPFHEIQSFRNKLSQHAWPMGHGSCQENLLPHGLLCAGHSSCQMPVPVWPSPGLQLPSGHIYLLWIARS